MSLRDRIAKGIERNWDENAPIPEAWKEDAKVALTCIIEWLNQNADHHSLMSSSSFQYTERDEYAAKVLWDLADDLTRVRDAP